MSDVALRKAVRDLLGPDFHGASLTLIEDHDRPDGGHDLVFSGMDGERIEASWFPSSLPGPQPAILYSHAHGARYEIGRKELTDGRPALLSPWLPDLRQRGYAVLAVEMPCFGSRISPTENALSKARLWYGRILFGQMLGELRAAVQWLQDQPGVDARRIGAMGISMGGTLSWWLGAMDQRVSAVATLCCMADMGAMIESGAHDGHGTYMTVPGLLNLARTGQVAGLIAPRPLFVGVGLQDWSTREPAFSILRHDLERAYGPDGAVRFHVEPDVGHQETQAMRHAALRFLEEAL